MMNATTGRRMSLADHISQSIRDILTTPIGSRVMRRPYGSLVPSLVDQPATPSNLLRLQAAAVQAIMRWEPRTTVRRARAVLGEAGQCTLYLERLDQGAFAATQQTVTIGAAA